MEGARAGEAQRSPLREAVRLCRERSWRTRARRYGSHEGRRAGAGQSHQHDEGDGRSRQRASDASVPAARAPMLSSGVPGGDRLAERLNGISVDIGQPVLSHLDQHRTPAAVPDVAKHALGGQFEVRLGVSFEAQQDLWQDRRVHDGSAPGRSTARPSTASPAKWSKPRPHATQPGRSGGGRAVGLAKRSVHGRLLGDTVCLYSYNCNSLPASMFSFFSVYPYTIGPKEYIVARPSLPPVARAAAASSYLHRTVHGAVQEATEPLASALVQKLAVTHRVHGGRGGSVIVELGTAKDIDLVSALAGAVSEAISAVLLDVQGSELRAALVKSIAQVEGLPALEQPSIEPAVAPARADAFITTEQAAQQLGMSRPYLAMLADNGELGRVIRSRGGHRRILQSAVDDYRQKLESTSTVHETPREAAVAGGLYDKSDEEVMRAVGRAPSKRGARKKA